jgi:HEAT repeat protein
MTHKWWQFALICCLTVSPLAAAEETTAALFEKAVQATNDDYVELRTTLLGRNDLESVLADVKAGEGDWQHKILAEALAGWRESPALYAQLWDYQPPSNMFRNPYPLMQRIARERFKREGRAIAPLVLELIWKKHEILYGALPEFVAEYKLESGLPALVDCLSRGIRGQREAVGNAIAGFGAQATPLLAAEIPGADHYVRTLIARTLGTTGDPDAAGPLQEMVRSERRDTAHEVECEALGALGAFAFLREQLASPETVNYPLDLARALRVDDSEETAEFLLGLARTAESEDLRVEAFRSVLEHPTDTRVASLCELLPEEPEELARESMVLSLGNLARYRPGDVIRDTLVQELDDPSEEVRRRAIEALNAFDEPSVTGKLLPFASSNSRNERQAALYVLKDRKDDRIAAAVIPLLEYDDATTRGYAADALLVNPTVAAVEPLGKRLREDEELQVRYRAARALAAIGGDEALKLLREALSDENEETVRSAIESGIRQFEAEESAP